METSVDASGADAEADEGLGRGRGRGRGRRQLLGLPPGDRRRAAADHLAAADGGDGGLAAGPGTWPTSLWARRARRRCSARCGPARRGGERLGERSRCRRAPPGSGWRRGGALRREVPFRPVKAGTPVCSRRRCRPSADGRHRGARPRAIPLPRRRPRRRRDRRSRRIGGADAASPRARSWTRGRAGGGREAACGPRTRRGLRCSRRGLRSLRGGGARRAGGARRLAAQLRNARGRLRESARRPPETAVAHAARRRPPRRPLRSWTRRRESRPRRARRRTSPSSFIRSTMRASARAGDGLPATRSRPPQRRCGIRPCRRSRR